MFNKMLSVIMGCLIILLVPGLGHTQSRGPSRVAWVGKALDTPSTRVVVDTHGYTHYYKGNREISIQERRQEIVAARANKSNSTTNPIGKKFGAAHRGPYYPGAY